MSTLAEMTHVCEQCGIELRYHGGPYKPRWCDTHRPAKDQARFERRHRRREVGLAPHPTARCSGCDARLLRKSESGHCLFCEVELGLRDESEVAA